MNRLCYMNKLNMCPDLDKAQCYYFSNTTSVFGWWCDQNPLSTICEGNFDKLSDAKKSLEKHIKKMVDNQTVEIIDYGFLMHEKNMDPIDTGLYIWFNK